MIELGYKPNAMTADNADKLCTTINFLIDKYLHVFPICIRSGWRSLAYNRKIGGAMRSQHILGNAIDLSGNDIALYLQLHQDILEEFDLYIEDPKSTFSWCHIQQVPPKSLKRVFLP